MVPPRPRQPCWLKQDLNPAEASSESRKQLQPAFSHQGKRLRDVQLFSVAVLASSVCSRWDVPLQAGLLSGARGDSSRFLPPHRMPFPSPQKSSVLT